MFGLRLHNVLFSKIQFNSFLAFKIHDLKALKDHEKHSRKETRQKIAVYGYFFNFFLPLDTVVPLSFLFPRLANVSTHS
jgi:hypothetical protein